MSSKPIALVTGGAQGIGAACGKALAADGYHVVLADVQDSVMEQAAALGGTGMICDMSDADAILAMFDKIEADLGPVSALVNNAGVAMPGDFMSYDLAAFDRVISINLRGRVCGAAAGGENHGGSRDRRGNREHVFD